MSRIETRLWYHTLALLLALVSFTHAASQIDSPVEIVEVGVTDTYREVVHAQQAQDNQLILTPDSCFFFPFGPSLIGQHSSSIHGAEFNGGHSFSGITGISNRGQLVQWPILPVNDGSWNIEVFIETSRPNVELIVRLGDVEHTVTTVASNGTTPQPWNLSATVTNSGATTAAIRWLELELVNLHGASALGTVRKVRLSGPSMSDDYLLRARWRPLAIHGGFRSASFDATGLRSDLLVMEQIPDYSSLRSLNFYAPVTTNFGYYGSTFSKVSGDPDGRFTASGPNFSMWNYGQDGTPPPLPKFSHLLALGHPEMTFGGFNHEGTGVKPRGGGWPLHEVPLTSFVSALAHSPGDPNEIYPFTRYTGSYWHPGEQRWRLYAIGNEQGLTNFRLPSSFIEVAGVPARQRTGHIVRHMLYRGWIRDTTGTWHQLDSQSVGAGPGAIINKAWNKTNDGWLTREMGGILHREYLQSGQTVSVNPPAEFPAYMTPTALSTLTALPMEIELERIVSRPDGTLDIQFSLTGNTEPVELSLYHGNHDGLTLIYEDNNQPDEWNGPLLLGNFAAGIHSVNIPRNALPAIGYGRLLAKSTEHGRFWSHRSAHWLAPLEPATLSVGMPTGIPVAQITIPNPTEGRNTTYQIESGNHDSLFALDLNTGVLSLARTATVEDVGSHPLTLTAKHDGWSGRLPAIHVEAEIVEASGPIAFTATTSLSFGHHSALPSPFHRRLTVTNLGNANLVLQQAVITGDPAFRLAVPLPGPIAASSSADLDLIFDPATVGHFSATLTLITNDSSRPPLTVSLSGGLNPDGYPIAKFDFDPNQRSGKTLDLDDSASLAWTTSPLVDHATVDDISLRDGPTGNALRFRAQRETDAQTPLEAGGNNASTWLNFSVIPSAAINFVGGSVSLDTLAWSSLNGTTSARWTLYASTDDGITWFSLGTQQGALISGSGTAAPLNLSWSLDPIGTITGPVRFILDPSTIGFSSNGAVTQRSIGCDNLIVTVPSIAPPEDPALPQPVGEILALFNFTPDLSNSSTVDQDASLALNWSTSDLIDHATGTGALDQGNQGSNNRSVHATPTPHVILSSNRESDAQTPLSADGENESTWFTFTVTPNQGQVLDFAAAILAMDTFAHSSLAGTTSAHWTVYYRRDSETNWTPLATFQGASVTGSGTTGPIPLVWQLASVGRSAGSVHFLLDPETSSFGTNGSSAQRRIGFGNIRLTAVCEAALDFATWCDSHQLTTDDDSGRTSAALKYALGLDPARPDFSPADISADLLTYPKGADAAAAGTLYQIEISRDLGLTDPWKMVTPTDDNLHFIQAKLPTEHPRTFARLRVSVP